MEPHSALANEGARRIAGRLIGGLIVAGAAIAVVVTLLQWETRPQTDDATVRANFVGIAPQVSGHIVDLRVRDNQEVREGDLLFVVDPRPYEIAVARAQAGLALTRKEVQGLRNGVVTADAGVSRATAQLSASAEDVARRETDPVVADAEIARLEAQRVASEAALVRARAELRNAEDHLARLEPLLPEKFVTEDRVDEARTRRVSAAMAAEQARTSVLAADAALDEGRAATVKERSSPSGGRGGRGGERERPRRRGGGRVAFGGTRPRVHPCACAVQRTGRQSQHLERRLRAERGRGLHARRHRHLVRHGKLPGDSAPSYSRRGSRRYLYPIARRPA